MTHQRPLVPEDLRRDPGALARAAAASVTRTALCYARAALSGSPILPIDVARRDFDDPTLNLVLRAASSPATIADTPALTQVAVAFLATLQPMSAAADLFGRGIGLSFDGSAAINLPAISLPAPAFVGEARPIPVQQATTAPGPTLSPRKLLPVSALVFVGDAMEENPDALAHEAGELGRLGVPAFMFQEGETRDVEHVFRDIARLTNGAYCRFDPGAARQLAELLRAVAVYAAGGVTALAARKDAGAVKLLGQLGGRAHD